MTLLPQRFVHGFLSIILISGVLPLSAAVPQDFAVDLKATVSETSSPHIVISWTQRLQGNITSQKIHRRLKGEVTWVKLADLSTTQISYTDSTAQPGVEYEYWMQRTLNVSPYTAMGYLSAGVNLPEVHSRGTLLLVVDDTMAVPLASEIVRLTEDLVADGWSVQQINAPRTGTAESTKALIQTAYDADPSSVKMVYLLGHVPVPYSGYMAPDGHSDHTGAWPTDGFYGDMNGTWTDSSVNTTAATDPRNDNVPGDGKFDQSSYPSLLELQVGRVDMHKLQKSPSATTSEISLLRRYLRKAHDFRYKQGAYASIPRRTLLRDGFGDVGFSEPIAINGWAPAFTCVGEPPASAVVDSAPAYQWFTYATNSSYLLGHGGGGGTHESVNNLGTTADFGRNPSRVVFTSMFGSYFGDWDATNSLMRSVLAGNAEGTSLGLTCFWVGRPNYFLHHLGMGETIGYATRVSQNAGLTGGGSYSPMGYSARGVHVGLMGDPALRLHMVEPPRNLSAVSSGGQATVRWTPSTDTAVQGYYVYRASTGTGPFTLLTPQAQTGTTYTDSTVTPAQNYVYMVRAVKVESVPGGSYRNLSLGSTVKLSVSAGAASAPGSPGDLTVSSEGVLSWKDNSDEETGFRIERKTTADGNYSTLATLPANATTYTDIGPFSHESVYSYRVIALGSVAESPASNEASFDALAGNFEFTATVAKVSKSAGVAQIAVKRFGGGVGAVSVNYATSNSSAVAGTHFTSTNGTLNWANGEIGTKYATVPITNTGAPQQARQFYITLSNATGGGSIGQRSKCAVLIEDTTATLPSPWNQTVVGTVSNSSSAVEAEGAIGSTTIGGIGLSNLAWIPNYYEAGHFIHQSRTGDGMLTAFVSAATPAQTAARFAVMVRDTTVSGAVMASTVTSVDSSYGTKFVRRTGVSGAHVTTGPATLYTVPRWIRISRAGNTFTSQASADGVTWTTLGSATVSMAATVQWGLFHLSDDLDTTNNANDNFQLALFQNVTFASLPIPASTMPSVTAIVDSSVSLSWPVSENAAGYLIECVGDDGTTRTIDITSGLTSSFEDTGLKLDTSYEYRIRAYNNTGLSSWSSPVRATTSSNDTSLPVRPGFVTLTITPGGGNVLSWFDQASNETGFLLERRVANGEWSPLATLPANTLNFTDTSARSGVIYTYRIRSFHAAGWSSWASPTALRHQNTASVTAAISSSGGAGYLSAPATPGNAYVPVSMFYNQAPVPFVTGQTLSTTIRSDYSGWVGMKFTVGATPITVCELGRWVLSGNTASHTVKLADATTGNDLPGASVTVATAGAPVGFKYATLAAPVTLNAYSSYYLLCQETLNGDKWYQGNTTLIPAPGVATINNAASTKDGITYTNALGSNNCHVPVSFTYSYAPEEFMTGHTMTTLRNDYTGWLGMEMTLGSADLLVSQLGRWVVSGNTASHIVKLVDAETGADIASSTVSTMGATANRFKYAPVASPVLLKANTRYYLLSQETAGGDQWHDFATPTAGTATGYQAWLLANGLPMDESGVGSATATPTNDGLPNLIKYGLGLLPGDRGHGGRLSYGQVSNANDNFLVFTYTRPEPAPSGITYAVESSADLSNWSSEGLVEVSNSVNAGLRAITVREATPLTSRRFMRLKISQN